MLSPPRPTTLRDSLQRTPGRSPSRPSLCTTDAPASRKVVRHHGYLFTKKLLRSLASQYYCLNEHSSKLYVFENYSDFHNWNREGQPRHMTAKRLNGSAIPCGPTRIIQIDALDDYDALRPVLSQGYYKLTLSVFKKMNSSKVEKLSLLAESREAYNHWIDAFEDVLSSGEETTHSASAHQMLRRHTTESTYSSLHSDTTSSLLAPTRPSSKSDAFPIQKTNAGSFLGASSASSHQRMQPPPLSRRYSEILKPADLQAASQHLESPPRIPLATRGRTQSAQSMRFGATQDGSNFLTSQAALASTGSFLSTPATTSTPAPPSSTRNVLLFVSTNGSTVGVSEAKIQQARSDLAALCALPGNYQPERGLDSFMDSRTFWLHGPPDYALTDVAFLRGRTRAHGVTSFAYEIETALRTFSMEVTHKARLSQWTSVATSFWLQVNEHPVVSYHQLPEMRHALFGLVYVPPTPSSPATSPHADVPSSSSGLAEAFPDGFPMEVLEVYTSAPANIYFSWRHWGAFTGSYQGRRGDGSLISITGFGRLAKEVGTGKLQSLHLFCHPEPLLTQLHSRWAPLSNVVTSAPHRRLSESLSEAPRRRRPSANSLDLTYDLQGLSNPKTA
ncbi:hypothetical protein SDRG_07059 [Saprolegnia diclina VS20]|uniref:PH domain-containing protein n=1 Tax=Saprolegnia diclina (strain VS20) TaxID=1156394 RepID=T0RY88_SAPDV|nr:hypothetical protein SDRG_07059 [Saprolegnia diclina VS20]EQC35347.1 hypothetical protein SDRG_07059 [Saprolegnia diclina VS20]|eukprot:XP_008611097.1 hypothetical protein SDRG_07059 [Saprolegnia diclina VS20]